MAIGKTDPLDQYLVFFTELADPPSIYGRFRERVPQRDQSTARIVGGLWYHLSEHIVDVLCIALAKLKSKDIRHYVIQTAYEELGSDEPEGIHTDLLRETLAVAGIGDLDVLALGGHRATRAALDRSTARLQGYSTDAEVCGFLLGMELVAYENIDMVVEYLGYTGDVAAAVRETPWTRTHHAIEEHHIRRAVSVFLESGFRPEEERVFMNGFRDSMRFWQEFWSGIADEVNSVQAQQQQQQQQQQQRRDSRVGC